jgi:serine/threonine protein kinase
MGNCQFKSENEQDNIKKISKSDFAFEYVIGRGGFGKVWKVKQKKTKQLYAMKEMLKARVIAKRSVHSVMNEKKFLS